MATNNPPSFRLPISLPADVHPAVADALKNHDDAITDLQQAIPVLKSSINAATGTTTSSSSNTSSQLAASDASETVIIPSPAANVIGFVNNQTGITAYTTLPADYGAFIILNDASPVAVTLTGATTVTVPWFAVFINLGAGIATLTPASGQINSATNLPLGHNTSTLVSYDGINFWAEPLGNVGTITGVTAGTGLTGGGTSGNVTLALATPVAVANGGTGTATPTPVAGTGITITGTWPNQTFSASGSAGLPVNNPTFTGVITGPHYAGNGATPTVIVGSGAGVGAIISIVGSDTAGKISITGGTGVPTGPIFTLTFAVAYASTPYVVLCPNNTDTQSLSGSGTGIDSTSTTGFSAGTPNPLSSGVVYLWSYIVVG